MDNSIALMLSSSPFGNHAGQETLDMAMVLGTFEIPTALFFVGRSVMQFNAIQPELIHTKNFVKGFSALPFYDVQDLFVCEQSLAQFGVAIELVPPPMQILDKHTLKSTLALYDAVVKL